jgi:rhodanese-related sulfurtransferase
MRLARVGHESVAGFILIATYMGEKNEIEQVSVSDVDALAQAGQTPQIVDVRRPAEHANGHVPGAVNIPLDKLPKEFEQLDPSIPTYVVCQGGYRSSLGASFLENAGFDKIYNVTGGTAAWIAAGLETEVSASKCASTR